MRKLKLSLEDLTVASFETAPAEESRAGTVKANGYLPPVETNTCETAAASCWYSACADPIMSCQYTCDCVSPTGGLCPTLRFCYGYP